MKIKVLSSVVLLSAVLSLAAVPGPRAEAAAAVLRVTMGGIEIGECGDTWTNACSLQNALDHAVAGDSIWVKAGVYKPTETAERTVSFKIGAGTKVYGGFAGTETALSQRSLEPNTTVLSGDIDYNDSTGPDFVADNTSQIVGNNSYHVVLMQGSPTPITATTVLDGFTITGGKADAYPTAYQGGGLLCDGSGEGHACSPTLRHLIFSGNYATYGGALHNRGSTGGTSSPTISLSMFIGNEALYDGGAIFNDGAAGTNNARITNVTFLLNKAGDSGGAILNGAADGGLCSPTIINTTFAGNSAAVDGTGGAIYNNGMGGTAAPVLKNVTFTLNSAGGAGAFKGYGAGSAPRFTNVIMWGDTAVSGAPEISHSGGTGSIDHSLVQECGGSGIGWDADCGTDNGGNLDADPLFVEAAPPLVNFSVSLPVQPGSPAIDHGTNTGCPAKDQRGIERPKDGDGNGTIKCDIGATEARSGSVTVKSRGSEDGWVLESAESSGLGGSRNASASTLRAGDDGSDRQYRSILSFHMALPEDAIVTSARLKIKRAAVVGSSPFNAIGDLSAEIKAGGFNANEALENMDFEKGSDDPGVTVPNTPSSGWYSAAFSAAQMDHFNLSSTVQLRLLFTPDDNDDLGADYIKFYSGNAGILSDRPRLVIKYCIP